MEERELSQIREVETQFVSEWGRMSSSWGINRTMAQIHALLFVRGEPMSVDDIIDRLLISRGNASMNLRDLMDWGIVRRVRRPGDRKDLYSTDADPIAMVARVVRERKRRELDPTSKAIEECVLQLPETPESEEARDLKNRLTGLLEVFRMVDMVYEQVFKTDESLRQTLKLFGRQD